jgi:hypothetical protein
LISADSKYFYGDLIHQKQFIMVKHTPGKGVQYAAAVIALLFCARVSAQTTVNAIPATIEQNAQTKAVNKSTAVSNNAMDKIDSASNKAFKGFTHMFKKKDKAKKPGTDSTHTHMADSTAVPVKTT